jgi:hypothetical protein
MDYYSAIWRQFFADSAALRFLSSRPTAFRIEPGSSVVVEVSSAPSVVSFSLASRHPMKQNTKTQLAKNMH